MAKNKKITIVLLLLVLGLILTLGEKEIIFAKDNKILVDNSILLEAARPVIEAYEKYYDIKNVNITNISETEIDDGGISVEYFVEITECLKYNTATELPQIKGVIKALNLDGTKMNTEEIVTVLNSDIFLSNYAKIIEKEVSNVVDNMPAEIIASINNELIQDNKTSDLNEAVSLNIASVVSNKSARFIKEIEDEYIGMDSIINIGMKVELDNNNDIINVEYLIFDNYSDDISLVTPKLEDEMIELGICQVELYINNAIENIAENTTLKEKNNTDTPIYYRTDARDYANKYTSNAAEKTCTTEGCTNQGGTICMDTSKYNNDYNWYCCNDCANYVSQAIAYGGIKPEKDIWEAGTLAWTNVGKLIDYFVNQKQYWEKSDAASCNAGGIIVLNKRNGNGYHVMMNVLNDTISRAFSAHTNDRLKNSYSVSSTFGAYSVDYYVFKNVSP